MTIQSSRFPHPDDQTHAGRKFAQLREVHALVTELTGRSPHVAYQVCQKMAVEIADENYPLVIDELKAHLDALNDTVITAII
jgi:hypothetical protein